MLKYDDAGMYIKGMKNENKHIERGKTVRLDAVAVTLLFVAGTVFSLLCENYGLIALSYVPFYVFLTYKFFSLDENFFSDLCNHGGSYRSFLVSLAILLFLCLIISIALGLFCVSIALLINSVVLFFLFLFILSCVFWSSSKEGCAAVTCVCPDDL